MAADSLKQKSISGAFWSAFQRLGVTVASFICNVVLARLLTPNDFGSIGLLTIFIVISDVFIQGGFASALIQRKKTENIDYTTVFYWNLTISILLYAGLFVSAPYIAGFYRIDSLSDVLQVLGLVLIINSFNIVQTTILRKTFQFNRIAKIEVISTLVSVFVAVGMAFLSFGVWSWVGQQMSLSMSRSLLLWSKTNWHPTLAFSTKSFREMFSYGSFLLLSDLLNNIVDNIQGLIIGRRYSASDMGFYAQAKKMEEIPTKSISAVVLSVTFPIFSSIQDEKMRLRDAIRKTMAMANYVNIPLMMMLIVIAKPLFIVLYSEKWVDSVDLFQILCIAGIVNCMERINYQAVSAVGRSQELFKWNVIRRIIGILLIVIGMNWGVHGILWGMVAGSYFTFAVNAYLSNKSTDYGIVQQIRDVLPLLLLSLLSSVPPFLITNIKLPCLLLLFAQILLFSTSYILLSYLTHRPEFNESIAIANKYISKFKK